MVNEGELTGIYDILLSKTQVGNFKERPVAVNGQVEIRPMMYLALSYDHRIIDGSTSVTFLVKVKEQLEDPVTLLMNI